MKAPWPGSTRQGSDFQLVRARGQTKAVPHVMQTVGTGLESLVGVLHGQFGLQG
jgi:hypothetical protein